MKKLLAFGAWIVGIALAIGAIIFVARKQHTAREKAEAARQKDCMALAITFDQKYSCAKEAQSRHDYLPWWYVLAAWPDGITPWVVIVTGLFIALQTRETRRAAQGAFLNAQAVINAERPWLVMLVDPHQGQIGGFSVGARNKGRTPAMIVAAYMGFAAVDTISDLPKEPPYGPGKLIEGRIVVAENAVWVSWFNRKTLKSVLGKDFDKAAAHEKQIYVFGTTLYRDLLGPADTPPHETRWICLFELNSEGDAIHNIEGIGVSDGYDQYT